MARPRHPDDVDVVLLTSVEPDVVGAGLEDGARYLPCPPGLLDDDPDAPPTEDAPSSGTS